MKRTTPRYGDPRSQGLAARAVAAAGPDQAAEDKVTFRVALCHMRVGHFAEARHGFAHAAAHGDEASAHQLRVLGSAEHAVQRAGRILLQDSRTEGGTGYDGPS